MKALENVVFVFGINHTITSERSDRRTVARGKCVAKVTWAIWGSDDGMRRVRWDECLGQRLAAKKIEFIIGGENLSLVQQMLRGCGRMRTGGNTDALIVHRLDFFAMSFLQIHGVNWNPVIEDRLAD